MLTGNFQSEMNYFEPSQTGREGREGRGKGRGGGSAHRSVKFKKP